MWVIRLQIEHHLALAFDAYMSGEFPVTGLEQKLTRHGYNVKTLAMTVNVQPKVIRSFLRTKLFPGQSQEIQEEMLAAGIPL